MEKGLSHDYKKCLTIRDKVPKHENTYRVEDFLFKS